MIQLIFSNMKIMKTKDMVLVRGKGCGGTTTLATGNAVRYDAGLKKIGIHLEHEYQKLYDELPITSEHQRYWNTITKQMYETKDMVSLMVKLADEAHGNCCIKPVEKSLTEKDNIRLVQGIEECKKILCHMGVKEQDMVLGIVNAGHPGGMMPFTENERDTLHHTLLPENLYLADASVLPEAMGNPPMLTIMALAKKIANQLKKR